MASGNDTAPDDPDAQPEEELAPDESPTPSWLPLLGISLALVALFAWLVTRPAKPSTQDRTESTVEPAGSARN